MNLINKKVTHKQFGIGSIVKHNDSSIEILFASENKKFVFPDGFEKHLKLHDKTDANLIEEMIQKKEVERKEVEWRREEEGKLQRKNRELRIEHDKLMNSYRLHPESQLVFWCDVEEQVNVFSEWKVFSGISKTGLNKGNPSKPNRLYPNSAVLLTAKNPGMHEKDRRIIGVYMVDKDFIGKLSEDGFIPAHSKYKLQLTEEESNQMLFWEYYANQKFPLKMTWNSGKHRYFDNSWMAQILLQIIELKSDPKEQAMARQFFDYFCKKNKLTNQDLRKPNGTLMRI